MRVTFILSPAPGGALQSSSARQVAVNQIGKSAWEAQDWADPQSQGAPGIADAASPASSEGHYVF